jgi:RNA polymerase sigma-70 factor (ECF subfamily)
MLRAATSGRYPLQFCPGSLKIILMDTTSLSFLDRLKRADLQAKDLDRLRDLYYPLLRRWISSISGLTRDSAETDDLVQDVLAVLLREVPTFERQREGSFRAWLKQTTRYRILHFWNAQKRRPFVGGDEAAQALEQLEDPDSELSRQWEKEHQDHVMSKLLAMAEPDFEPATFTAFARVALAGIPAAQVAQELGMTVPAVAKAKSRVLKRLRELKQFFLE